MENKEKILQRLFYLLKAIRAGSDIVNLKLEQKGHDEYCVIVFGSGNWKKLDITADSGLAIIEDVLKAL